MLKTTKYVYLKYQYIIAILNLRYFIYFVRSTAKSPSPPPPIRPFWAKLPPPCLWQTFIKLLSFLVTVRYVTPPHPGVHGASVSFESLELLSVGLESPQALWSPTAFKPLGPSPVSSLDTRSSRSPRASANSGGLASPANQGPVEALGDVAWTLGSRHLQSAKKVNTRFYTIISTSFLCIFWTKFTL